jgi:hypothetical protein
VPGYLQNREASTLTRLAAARQIRPTMPEPLTEHPYLARAPGRSAGSAGRGRGLVTREFQGSADGDCLLAGFPRVRGLPGTGRRNWLVRAGWRWCSGRLTSGSADRWPEDRGVCACVRCGVPAAVHPGVAVRSRSSPVDPEPDPGPDRPAALVAVTSCTGATSRRRRPGRRVLRRRRRSQLPRQRSGRIGRRAVAAGHEPPFVRQKSRSSSERTVVTASPNRAPAS